MEADLQPFYALGVALAIGLLIGLERGWKRRAAEEGERVAGVRTFGLLGLLGGVAALLAQDTGWMVFALMFLALAGTLGAAYLLTMDRRGDVSATSLVAALLTVLLGALATVGQMKAAAAAAVITALLLSLKPVLHRWISRLSSEELLAALKLLLMSVVLLPVLPDRGYGPWGALNPYEIWWMVVLIAAISFAGYFAMKIAGTRRGTLFTGLFAGLASSTALTLHFARLARRAPSITPALGAGILLACGTMFPRMTLVAAIVDPDLLAILWPPALAMAAPTFGITLWYWRRLRKQPPESEAPLRNPLELRSALSFGALLALVMLLAEGLEQWLGEAGVLALAAASGIADVDAITLSLSRMGEEALAGRIVATGIVLAAAVNSLVKGTMAGIVGGRALGLRVGLPLAGAAAAGPAAAWLLFW